MDKGQNIVVTEKDKELMVRVFTYYYLNYVWGEKSNDNEAANTEDYRIREFRNKYNLNFPIEIQQRW